MTEQTSSKTFPLEKALEDRMSPRAFSGTAVLTPEHLGSAFEAARWSASSDNTQPWKFVVGFRGDEVFNTIASALAPGNFSWANRVSALVANITRIETDEGKPMTYGVYDLGQAVAHFSVQATADGLSVHQMGGFDSQALGEALALDVRHTVLTVMTVGLLGGPEDLQELSERLQAREGVTRVRKPLSEIVGGSAHYA